MAMDLDMPSTVSDILVYVGIQVYAGNLFVETDPVP